MKYLITGGNGFIGANLVRKLLTQNKHVFVLTEPNPNLWRLQDILDKITLVECDITNKNQVNKAIEQIKPDVIFHMAAMGVIPGKTDLKQLFDVNFFGTINLLEACKKVGFQCFINTGSASEYGNKNEPLREDMQLEPQDPYSLSKASSTMYCNKEARLNNLPIYTIRPFGVYGAYEHEHRIIPTLLRGIKTGETVELASPNSVRDFVYIKDVVDFYIMLSEKRPPNAHVFNCGTGKQYTIKELVEIVEKVTGEKLNVKWGTVKSRPWEFKVWQANMQRSHEVLGWKAKYSLEDGIRDVLDPRPSTKSHVQSTSLPRTGLKSTTSLRD